MRDQTPAWVQINRAVEAFEAAREQGNADLSGFLPEATDPQYLRILVELIRVEMELEWPKLRPRVEDYLTRFPVLSQHAALIEEVASEEIRQRRLIDEDPAVAEYAQRLGINLRRLHELLASSSRSSALDDENAPSTAVLDTAVRKTPPGTFPALGRVFLGFRLEATLGLGAFSRVYLARQTDLADRPVVLKISTSGGGEPQKLARLQHTHIVPIYALHYRDDLEVICMPYFGPSTLQHVMRRLEAHNRVPQAADTLLAAIADCTAIEANFPRTAEQVSPSVHAQLRNRSYADGVLWIAACLSRGLAHAHERGVLHLDLKPANILIADSGQPMLLDFNLAYSSSRDSAHIGGTLPYMAPEHLQSLRVKQFALDHRADIFSVGVVLYELLTGRLPFIVPTNETSTDLAHHAALRFQPVVPPRYLNRQVSPATEAIVLRCLQPEAARRYGTANDLAEDLECQFAHQPLRHARDPSTREKAQKWARRHPLLTSGGSIACFAFLALTVLVLVALYLRQQLMHFEAHSRLHDFRADLAPIRYLLHAPRSDRSRLELGMTKCREALKLVRELDGDPPRYFTADDHTQYRQELAELLFLMVRAAHKRWMLEHPNAAAPPDVGQWLLWNSHAEQLWDSAAPQALRTQKALLQRLKDPRAAPAAAAGRAPASRRHPQDLYLSASDDLAEGRVSKARTLLQVLLRQQPDHLWAWIALGQCAEAFEQWEQAIACYTTAIALGPDYPWPYYLRGLALVRAHKLEDANADFDTASGKRPEWWEPYHAQAVVQQKLGNHRSALEGIARAMQHGGPVPRLLFIRSRLHDSMGNKAAAGRDLQRGLALKTDDELAFVACGLARLGQDPQAALSDFDRALQKNEFCAAALQNKAHVLSEILEQPEAAISVLDRLIASWPDDVNARAARAVLLARLQQRDDALREVKTCLALSDAPAVEYQLAGVYALTSKLHAADADAALELLQSALRRGWGHQLIDTDRDLQSLRNSPRFQSLLARQQQR